jgi:hypothetical protein
MSIIKIKDICLCTGLIKDNNENRSAYDWLTEQGVDFKHLAYWDPAQHPDVFSSLQTWVHDKDINTFPILHYHEVDEHYNITGVVLVGLAEITSSNIVELSKL